MNLVEHIQAATGIPLIDWKRLTGASNTSTWRLERDCYIQIRKKADTRYVFPGVAGIPLLPRDYRLIHHPRKQSSMVGRRFHSLVVIGDTGTTDEGGTKLWKCRCDCGSELTTTASWLKRGVVETCGCEVKPSVIPTKKEKLRGAGEITPARWTSIVMGARVRHLSVEVDAQHVWELFLKQNRKCAFSGESLSFDSPTTASLDRKDSSKGYTKGNLQWVHKRLNLMKMALPDLEFIKWCKAVADHQRGLEEVRCRLGGDENSTVTSNSPELSSLPQSPSTRSGDSDESNPLREQHPSGSLNLGHTHANL